MLTCRLLGPVEVWFDDERVDLGYPRQRALLAILLVDANRLVMLDTLIHRIWGDQPPASAARTLYADLSKLRRALAPLPELHVTRHTGGYQIDADPTTIDLHRFHDLITRARHSENDEDTATFLDDALALWRDEPFADLDIPWLTTIRTSLDNEKHTAQLDRNDAYLRLGRHADLLTGLVTATANHPLDERLAAQYIRTLYRSGRTADALTHYEHIRHRLTDELGVDPGPALQDLHEQLLRNDLTPPTTTPAPTAIPRQLPAHAPHFVGRTTELAELTALVDNTTGAGGTVVISAIDGAGGIGKTWLALHWAYRHLDCFPDGQLFVDLRGFTPDGEPITPQAAVRGFLDGLGANPNRIPSDLDAQLALYRSTIAGKRMLIVLDNAADAAQITPLLPGSPTCTVIVTSRRYLSNLATGHHVRLNALTGDESRHLLTTRLGADRLAADPAAVDALLAVCAGFPLALGIVAGRALAYPDFPLSALAAELTDTTSALGALADTDAAASLPAVLSWSVRALTTEQARVFALLGIAPGPDISLPATAGLTGLSEGQTQTALRALEHASLVQRHLPGRYRMHDLIRRYATDTAHQELAPDVRDAALRRVLDFLTHTADTAHRFLNPHALPVRLDRPAPGVRPQPLPDDRAAMAWFDAEHPVLLAAQHAATGHAWQQTVWHLAWTLNTFHYRRGRHRDQLAVWQVALDAAAHLPDPVTGIIAYRYLGLAYVNLGCHEDGIGRLCEALALAEEHHDLYQQAHTHRGLAFAWERQRDDKRALAHSTDALGLFRALDQPAWEADALNAVGWYAARLGEYDSARTHCEAALTLHRRHDNAYGEADTLDSLGYIAHHAGDHHQAIDCYQQALTLRRALGNASSAADTLDHLGHPHVALGEYDQARAAWQEAVELYQSQGHDSDVDRMRQQLDALSSSS